MKKVLLLLAICVALVALLASCGSDDKVTTTAAKTTTQAPTVQTTVAKTEPVETTEAPSTKAPTTNEFGQSSNDLLAPDYVEKARARKNARNRFFSPKLYFYMMKICTDRANRLKMCLMPV